MNVVVIPAYRPGPKLLELIAGLKSQAFTRILVVDDGSGPACEQLFSQLQSIPQVQLLRHAVNLGKGAALRTGFNHALCHVPGLTGVVTADADGQHHPDDIRRVSDRLKHDPAALVLGVRDFSGDVPLRSRIGNTATRWIMRLLVGQSLADTQTGLRGIPAALLPALLKVSSAGYEFELDMLINAKHNGIAVVQEPIRTIYEAGNRGSHFNPLLDSMRIYMVLLRFGAVSLLTAVLDNAVFLAVHSVTGGILSAQVAGRLAAMSFNYSAARKAVFFSEERHLSTFTKYVALVALNGLISFALIKLLITSIGLPVFQSKIFAETLLFGLNFLVQRDIIFTRRRGESATDWTRYYTHPAVTAKLTRKYTSSVLTGLLRKYVLAEKPRIVEIGGANSCFMDAILTKVRPQAYHVVDTNEFGLELLRARAGTRPEVRLHMQDVASMNLDVLADVVFSVGLIEHFDCKGTHDAIQAHLELVKHGGYAILAFPTPTWLYRAARGIVEAVGLWKFPDERPLERSEVLDAIGEQGRVVFEKTLWPLVFTQHMIVVQKNS